MERRPPRRLRQPRQVNPAINTQLNQDRLLFVPQSFFNPGADIPTNPTNHSVAVLYDVLLKFPEKEYGFGDLVLGVIENRNQRAIRLTRRIHQGRNLGLERY